MKEVSDAIKHIRKHKGTLTKQQVRTLKGQVLSGDIDGAMKGLEKILHRLALGGDR